MLVFGVIYAVLIEIFLVPLLTAFGATAEIMPYAKEYTRITAIGMPFLIVNNGMSNLARADGSPKFYMCLNGCISSIFPGRECSVTPHSAP